MGGFYVSVSFFVTFFVFTLLSLEEDTAFADLNLSDSDWAEIFDKKFNNIL